MDGESLHNFWTTSLQSEAQVTCLFRGFQLAVYHSPSSLTLDLDGGLSSGVWGSLLTDHKVVLNTCYLV